MRNESTWDQSDTPAAAFWGYFDTDEYSASADAQVGSPSHQLCQDIFNVLDDLVEGHVPSSRSRTEHIGPFGHAVCSAAQDSLNTTSESVSIDSTPIATSNGEGDPWMFDILI
jgi:hypothetical protein